MSLTLVTPPAQHVLDLISSKVHLRVSEQDATDDFLITDLLAAVDERAELWTQRALLTQTWNYVLDGFPREGYIELPKPPLISVTSVQYVDTQGVTQTWPSSKYLVQAPAGPRAARGRLALPFASVWPITLRQMGAVTVQFVCGYGNAPTTVPGMIRSALRLDLGSLYTNREGVVMGGRASFPDTLPMGVDAIYFSYRSWGTQKVAA
jgi:uncharacterized phiE125 gp8 family phage protein